LFEFIHALHTSVTRSLGKEMAFTLSDAERLVEASRATSCDASTARHEGCSGGRKLSAKILVSAQ
tara:strand:+ start:6175 stop:6369 length:195 start_codon:yes stop_codon:yes gene_type:complete